jgi:hypothetical protein
VIWGKYWFRDGTNEKQKLADLHKVGLFKPKKHDLREKIRL